MENKVEISNGVFIDLEKSAEENVNNLTNEARREAWRTEYYHVIIAKTFAKLVDYNLNKIKNKENNQK